jgi:hypothetical protein
VGEGEERRGAVGESAPLWRGTQIHATAAVGEGPVGEGEVARGRRVESRGAEVFLSGDEVS